MLSKAIVVVLVGVLGSSAWADPLDDKLYEYSKQAMRLHLEGIELQNQVDNPVVRLSLAMCGGHLPVVAEYAQTYVKLRRMSKLVSDPANMEESRKLLAHEAQNWKYKKIVGEGCLSSSRTFPIPQHADWLRAVGEFLVVSPIHQD